MSELQLFQKTLIALQEGKQGLRDETVPQIATLQQSIKACFLFMR
jgi:hypothetical protein